MTSEVLQSVDIEELCSWIESQGWRPGRVSSIDTFDAVWYRRFCDVVPGCYGNPSKEGIQIALQMWDYRKYGHNEEAFRLVIVAKPDDGEWVDLSVYSLSSRNLKDVLDSQVQKLIRAWRAVQSDAVVSDE